ncbi:MAG: 5-nitroimidazole antibiotic resistance protein [Firmicutes bacterium HGW-Firmicutes-16]|nr:MAG: 5-nitroimidazole antibiotic resistance protein [Firmicutes bacterium HGW-Firmicutes-16]
MFRKMRRFKQELPKEDTAIIFEKGSHGVLAVSGDECYPYAVPMSYVYTDGKLYFHGAKQGHKLDAIANSAKASFCVVAQDRVVPETFTTIFSSAIAFGQLHIIEDDDEKREALRLFSQKYFSVNGKAKNEEEIEMDWSRVYVIALEIEHMSGKASMDIIKDRENLAPQKAE